MQHISSVLRHKIKRTAKIFILTDQKSQSYLVDLLTETIN